MTSLTPEDLLSRLLQSPGGVQPSDPDAWAGACRVLEARGHVIVRRADGAWSLACGPRHFDPARFEASRRGRFGRPMEVWERLGSTNARAWEGVESGTPPGWVVLSEEQEAGRGRQGRRWLCPPHAGLLFSLVVPADLTRNPRPQLLPLALALGVCEALRRRTGRDVRLKWPNDLMLQERKLAGLLLESRPRLATCVVVGCGINVQVPPRFFSTQRNVRAASLSDEGAPLPSREAILAEILAALERRLEDWKESRSADILAAWAALDVVQGREVEAHLSDGVHRGTALGLNDAGMLCLRLPSGEVRLLSAGEVHLR